MRGWTSVDYYSITHDDNVCKISVIDDNGREHFGIIRKGKDFRERKRESVFFIIDLVENGRENNGEIELPINMIQ